MNIFRIYDVSPGMTYVLFILIVVVLLAFVYFLARSFFKEHKRILEEKGIDY